MVNAKLVSIFFSYVGIMGTAMIQLSPNLTDYFSEVGISLGKIYPEVVTVNSFVK